MTVLAALGGAVAIAAPAHSAAVSTKPQALKLLINGKQLRITQFNGADYYNPIKASTLHVTARWKGSLSGTGYKVVISTTEPSVRTWRTCSTGTSCPVNKSVPILKGQEFSWTVRILKKKGRVLTIVGGFMVCLARGTTPS